MMLYIASEYSEVPAGRYPSDGEFNGERFREEFLLPALRDHQNVTVKFEGTEGYGSSFLDEAFGGLVREGYYSAHELHRRLKLESDDPVFLMYVKQAWRYINNPVSKSVLMKNIAENQKLAATE